MRKPTEHGPRFSTLAESDLTEAQRRVYRAIASGPRGGVRGPFHALLRSPELADRVHRLGEYVRFENALPARLNELAILVTARFWGAQYEWHAHAPHAARAGLDAAAITDIAQGRRPAGMQDDETIVYGFCTELHEQKSVSDATWNRALALLGERGVIELIGVCGYYSLLAMVLNCDRHPLPDGVEPPLAPARR